MMGVCKLCQCTEQSPCPGGWWDDQQDLCDRCASVLLYAHEVRVESFTDAQRYIEALLSIVRGQQQMIAAMVDPLRIGLAADEVVPACVHDDAGRLELWKGKIVLPGGSVL